MKDVIKLLEEEINETQRWLDHTQNILDLIDFKESPKKLRKLISGFNRKIDRFNTAIKILNEETVKQEQVCPFCSMNGDNPSFCQC